LILFQGYKGKGLKSQLIFRKGHIDGGAIASAITAQEWLAVFIKKIPEKRRVRDFFSGKTIRWFIASDSI
jgi:hypothetical protein